MCATCEVANDSPRPEDNLFSSPIFSLSFHCLSCRWMWALLSAWRMISGHGDQAVNHVVVVVGKAFPRGVGGTTDLWEERDLHDLRAKKDLFICGIPWPVICPPPMMKFQPPHSPTTWGHACGVGSQSINCNAWSWVKMPWFRHHGRLEGPPGEKWPSVYQVRHHRVQTGFERPPPRIFSI